MRNIDPTALQHDISSCSFVISPSDDLEELVSQYNTCLSDVLDKHAPIITKLATDKCQTPWYTEECKTLKTEKRRAERAWRKTKLNVHLDIPRDCVDK